MFFWNVSGAVAALKKNSVSWLHVIIYAALLILFYFAHLMPCHIATTLYLVFVDAAKNYLECKTSGLDLELELFTHYDASLALACAIITLLGIAWCFLVTKRRPLIEWIKEFITIACIVSIRMMIMLTILVSGSLIGIGSYFGYHLSLLEPAQPTGNIFSRFVATINPINLLKSGWNALLSLFKAQEIFEKMNTYSFGAYIATLIIGLISTVIFFLLISKHMNRVMKKN